MAAPAKLEFDSWIETVRKHIEQTVQTPYSGRPNFHRGKRRAQGENAPVQAALESLKSLYDELVARAAAIDPSESSAQVSTQVAEQVVSALVPQLTQQLSDQLSTLLDAKFQQLQIASSRLENDERSDSQSSSLGIVQQQQSADFEAQLAAVQEELAVAYKSIAGLEMKLAGSKNLDWSVESSNESKGNESAVIVELEAEIASLRSILASLRDDCWHVPDSRSEGDTEKLAAELADLKQQNAELASQLAEVKSGLHNPPHLYLTQLNQESMTWEQRKKLILQQFENESTGAFNAQPPQSNRVEIEEVLRTSQAEIDRRDQEIAELKSIVEQQSNAHDGVAIGAAAIAQMLDSDELVRLEREKLAAIQVEWESKLREAEVQISTERARLSRERLELEALTQKLSEQIVHLPAPATSTADQKVEGKPVRRWLEHLGLRDK